MKPLIPFCAYRVELFNNDPVSMVDEAIKGRGGGRRLQRERGKQSAMQRHRMILQCCLIREPLAVPIGLVAALYTQSVAEN